MRAALEEAALPVESSDAPMVPNATISLDDTETAKKVLRLIDALDEHDDIDAVYANFDIPDSILDAVEA